MATFAGTRCNGIGCAARNLARQNNTGKKMSNLVFLETIMNLEQDVSDLIVCRYFLRSEFAKGTFHSDPTEFSDEKIRKEMTAFGQHHPSNPAVVWLGYSPTDKRSPVTWKLVPDINVQLIISKGLNPAWKAALQAVNRNFFRFIMECRTTYNSEYDRSDLPSDELSLIIGIVHPGSPNEIELVDGSHRLASMILKGVRRVEGYAGFLC